MDSLSYQLLPGPRFAANQYVEIGSRHNLNLFFQLQHIGRQANHLGFSHLLEGRRRARQHILAFQLFNQQRIAQRARRQRGNQPKLFIAENIELIGLHAIQR